MLPTNDRPIQQELIDYMFRRHTDGQNVKRLHRFRDRTRKALSQQLLLPLTAPTSYFCSLRTINKSYKNNFSVSVLWLVVRSPQALVREQ